METNPSWFSKNGKGEGTVAGLDTSRFPVEMVSWEDAADFCRKLTFLESERVEGRAYRLPTEAEWEYACRAGTESAFYTGSTMDEQDENCDGEFPDPGHGLGRTTTVGSLRANAFGLYDILGNVCEWCQDRYDDDYYKTSPLEDPQGPTTSTYRVLRQFDEQRRFTSDFAEQLDDSRRDPMHSKLEMVRSRVFGILAGYKDQNDHDALRSDVIFKLLADRLPKDSDLASQPTLSRVENSISTSSLLSLEEWFLERFVNSFAEPPREITLDIDVFDDPTHGQQQLTFYHGFYEQYQYLVRAITCAENDLVVLPVLLFGTADPPLGVMENLERVVARLREKFPGVLIRVRADAGFARPRMYEVCERLEVDYSIGLGMNAVLKHYSDELLKIAVNQLEATGQPQRLFTGVDYQAAIWSSPRWVVLKCEANAQGTNCRAVFTNRRGAHTLPQGVYGEYAERGESENRNKELKCELWRGSAERSSLHGQLLPHVPSLPGEQHVGFAATSDRRDTYQRTDGGRQWPMYGNGQAPPPG